ncbi:hypothetical protein, partial [Kaarinaea lacus]
FHFSISSAGADDDYTHHLYTEITLSYWCTHKKIPSSKKQVADFTKIDEDNPAITFDYDTWLEMLSYEINDNVLTIIKRSKTIARGQNQITITSKSSSNCGLRELIDNYSSDE